MFRRTTLAVMAGLLGHSAAQYATGSDLWGWVFDGLFECTNASASVTLTPWDDGVFSYGNWTLELDVAGSINTSAINGRAIFGNNSGASSGTQIQLLSPLPRDGLFMSS